jgi:DNA polymerase-3 subunit chi
VPEADIVEVAFHHCAEVTASEALPRLLEQHLAAGRRVHVRVDDLRERRRLDEYLWTFDPDSFLPHAAMPCETAEDQPVLLAGGSEPLNGATVCVVLDPAHAPDPGTFPRVDMLFDEADPELLDAARRWWTRLRKEDGVSLSYWRLGRGEWERVR